MEGREAPPIVGRELELRRLESFLRGDGAAACLVLSGEAGIGKTTLWQAGLDLASRHGHHVLSARTSEAEQTLSFAALADLVDGLSEEDLGAMPEPQRRALEVALRRADPAGGPPDPFAIAAGFLNALRAAAARTPLLVAIDDVQWLDHSSSDSLLFAARRLAGGRARFLLTRRAGSGPELERALLGAGVDVVEVSALSLGAVARILSDRLGLTLPRQALRKVHEGSHGNPLFALELARLPGEATGPAAGGQLPLPDLARAVFGGRIRRAGVATRRVLLATALSEGLSEADLANLAGPLAIEDAVAAGFVVLERSRVRPAHPMLAAAARDDADANERASLHVQLAAVVADPTSRARHLAIATAVPDARVADGAAAAAELAASHGRIWEAIELAEHALRLTPPGSPARGDRLIALARCYLTAGQPRRTTDLLTSRMTELAPGRHRGLAHLLVADAADAGTVESHVERALAEAGGDPEVQALAFSRRAIEVAVGRMRPSDDALRWAERGLSAAASAHAGAQERARSAMAWVRAMRGEPIGDVAVEATAAGRGTSIYDASIERVMGVRFGFRGEVAEARALFGRLRSVAEERGELRSIASIQLQLCEVELRAGHLPAVTHLLEDFDEALLAAQVTPEGRRSFVARLRAVLAALTGEPAQTARWAAEVLGADPTSASPDGTFWGRLEAERAMGIASLFRHDATTAIEHLWPVWDRTRREHVDPGAFPVAGDLVEALVGAGRFDDATEVVEWLRLRSLDQRHPWGLATAAAGESLLRLARADRYVDDAGEALAASAGEYGRLGLDFDRARSLSSLGAIQRRHKQRAAARASLEEAAALFEQNGSSGWADRARRELDRVSGRRSAAAGDLTPTEQRVVSLAADGMSNKEIARRLFVSVNTVEGHLSRAYAKLGVRSRSQLVHRLSESPDR